MGGKISTSLHFFEILAPFIFHSFMFSLRLIQDKANCYGGKWIVRLRKGIADRCWENLILAMIGEQFMVGDEICGAVVSVRFQVRNTASPIEMVIFFMILLFFAFQEDILSIWNRSANDHAITSQIRTSFRRVLNLPSSVVCEYKAHNDSIKYVEMKKCVKP